MKIYTLTFHWATNYGAVLQAYALQQFLIEQGFDVQIIDYVPKVQRKTFFKAFRARSFKQLLSQLDEYKKEKKINYFRRKYLHLTLNFATNEALKKFEWENGIFICGSDQIWNPYFTMDGEKKVTTSYFFDFVSNGSPKIAYAASFGTEKLEQKMVEIINTYLEKFSLLTVREQSAVNMLSEIGYESFLVCDPVFLLKKEKYMNIVGPKQDNSNGQTIFKYILHQNQKCAHQIAEFVAEKKGLKFVKQMNVLGIEDWLKNLMDCQIVVTNSFHVLAFSIMFHKPFIAVLVKNSGMNDRIFTLLKSVNLLDFAITEYDENEIMSKLNQKIDWNEVDKLLENQRQESSKLLLNEIQKVLE